jgi:hypothetical protein
MASTLSPSRVTCWRGLWHDLSKPRGVLGSPLGGYASEIFKRLVVSNWWRLRSIEARAVAESLLSCFGFWP